MKKIKMLTGMLTVLLLFTLCAGCVGREQKKNIEKILAPFERNNIPELHMQQEQDDLSIELNRAVFVENLVIIDYIMKSPDLKKYDDVFLRFQNEHLSGSGGGIAVEEKLGEKRMVAYLELEECSISQEDTGEEVEVIFESFYGADLPELGSGIKVTFPVKIDKVFTVETVEIGEEFTYKGGTAVVESIDYSRFQTDVHMDLTKCPDFMTDLCAWEISDDSGKTLHCFGGSDEVYQYSALPEDCKEIGLTLIQYKREGSYDRLGEMLKIPLR